MKQRVSIIIVSYNTKDLLADCLESIKSQYDAAEIETIVVDNASSDGSADHVSRAYPDVKLIRNSENKGFAAANNQGVEVSGGEYVLFLNSDTLLKDGAIEGMLDVFDKHPETGLCGPKLLNADGSVQRNVYHFTTFRAILARYTVLKYFGLFKKARDYYRMRNFDYGKFAKVDRVMGAAMMTTRKILDEVGGMDEGMFFYFEDVDLCKQINMAGYEICFTPESQIVHLGGASSASLGNSKTLMMFFESMFYYFRKNRGKAETFCFGAFFKPAALLYILLEFVAGLFKAVFLFFVDRKKAKVKFKTSRQAGLFLAKHTLKFIVC